MNSLVGRLSQGIMKSNLQSMASNIAPATGTIYESIRQKLLNAFTPVHLEVRNESYMHNVPAGSETHFKVVLVSDKFNGSTPISRHRLVNEVLKEEISGPVHALSIVAMTPGKWREKLEKGESIGQSPKCRGGDGSLPPKKA